ncbi:MAG: hypothetical protein LBC31_12715 [Treponema sp.]|nr:hypothetical protein [Treponema sp.]
MKKFTLISFFMFLIFSCSYDRGDTTVVNNSNFPMRFKFSYTAEQTLSPGQSVTFHTEKMDVPWYEPEKRIAHEFISNGDGGGTFVFRDRTSHAVEVENDAVTAVTLSAGGWMDDLSIIAGNTGTGTVYTDNPTFTATRVDGYPAIIEIAVDASGKFLLRIW